MSGDVRESILEWLNEPPAWRFDGSTLTATAAPRTDFWRATKYGVVRDNGHLLGRLADGDVTAEVKVSGVGATQYDQAGLMLRLNNTTWLKCSVEVVDGVRHAAVVVTRDYSDWSIVPLPPAQQPLWLRLVRQGDAVEVFSSHDGRSFRLLRLAYVPVGPALIGPMLAAPEDDGFTATFAQLKIEDA